MWQSYIHLAVSSLIVNYCYCDKSIVKGSLILATNLGAGDDPGLGSQLAGTEAINPEVDCHYFPPVAKHHRPLAGTKLYCLVTEAHVRKQLIQGL